MRRNSTKRGYRRNPSIVALEQFASIREAYSLRDQTPKRQETNKFLGDMLAGRHNRKGVKNTSECKSGQCIKMKDLSLYMHFEVKT